MTSFSASRSPLGFAGAGGGKENGADEPAGSGVDDVDDDWLVHEVAFRGSSFDGSGGSPELTKFDLWGGICGGCDDCICCGW
jgi:hypothetical protein